jgi:hypothetical protein
VPHDEARTQAPHINVTVFARGLLNHLRHGSTSPTTPHRRRSDSKPRARLRQATLLAQPSQRVRQTRHSSITDIVLQGEGEPFSNV